MSLAQRLQLDTGQSLQRGTLIHAWFEQIEWLDGGEPDEKTLRDVAAALVSSPGLDVNGLLERFRRALAAPAIRAALSRSSYEKPATAEVATPVHAEPHVASPRWEVRREKPFVLREGDVILSGSIDRLVVLYDGDRAIGADVLDFKTDVLPAGTVSPLPSAGEGQGVRAPQHLRPALSSTGRNWRPIAAPRRGSWAWSRPGIGAARVHGTWGGALV